MTPGLQNLFQQGRQLVYHKDDVIIRPGDTPSGIYCLVSGCVRVYSLSKDGEPNIIMTLRPNDIFPIAWAVSGIMGDLGFAAIELVELRRIAREDFCQRLQADPIVAQDILQLLAGQFFTLANELDNLQYRSAREKVVFRLIFLAHHFGQPSEEAITITTRVTNDYLARSTNMTRETASRELSRLYRKQLIHNADGHIVIPDLWRLSQEISQNFNPLTLSLD